VTLGFLARRQARTREDPGRLRDGMAVLPAIVQRMDSTIAGFMNGRRARRGKQDRQARAIRAVEDRLEQGVRSDWLPPCLAAGLQCSRSETAAAPLRVNRVAGRLLDRFPSDVQPGRPGNSTRWPFPLAASGR
jgi:hypothetical protein